MRLAVSVFAVLATATAALAATDAELKTMIVGNWADSESCKDGYLMFNADGSFVSKAPEGSPADDDFTGTYTILDGKLSGKTSAFEMPTVPISFDAGKLVMGAAPNQDTLMHCK
jgi:hypothetical protein